MKGYQYLEQNFFELCMTRRIKGIPMLLLVYLRGLYCRFQKPTFNWKDTDTLKHLGITQPTLRRARDLLKERGVLLYSSGNGIGHPTEYMLLGSVLLPGLKVKENRGKGERNLHLEGKKLSPSIYTSYQRVKKQIDNTFEKSGKAKPLIMRTQKDIDNALSVVSFGVQSLKELIAQGEVILGPGVTLPEA